MQFFLRKLLRISIMRLFAISLVLQYLQVEFLIVFAESFLRSVQLSLIGADRKSAAVQKDNHRQFLKIIFKYNLC